jgi:hypothetical protein
MTVRTQQKSSNAAKYESDADRDELDAPHGGTATSTTSRVAASVTAAVGGGRRWRISSDLCSTPTENTLISSIVPRKVPQARARIQVHGDGKRQIRRASAPVILCCNQIGAPTTILLRFSPRTQRLKILHNQ